jgi:hypothetical protein
MQNQRLGVVHLLTHKGQHVITLGVRTTQQRLRPQSILVQRKISSILSSIILRQVRNVVEGTMGNALTTHIPLNSAHLAQWDRLSNVP